MASGDYTPPPSFSSGDFRNVEPQFPEHNINPSTVDSQAPPSMSSMGINPNSESQLWTEGQRQLVDDEYHVQPQSLSNIRPAENSFTGGDVYRVHDPSAQAPDLDAVGNVNKSEVGLNHDSGYVSAPSESTMVHENQSNPGHGSTTDATQAYDPLENVAFSIPGRHFKQANLTGPYNIYN